MPTPAEPAPAGPARRGRLLARLSGARPVLMYHGVDTVGSDPNRLFVTPARFATQMRALRLLGLRGVSMAELCDARRAGRDRGLVGLTFDDGYVGVLHHAAPVLERHGFSATLYAVSGRSGGENLWDPPPRHRLLDDDELRSLQARGWEIGSHSVTHLHLPELDDEALRHEVAESRAQLARVTGRVPRTFCYPFGDVDLRVTGAVRVAGYTYACAVRRHDDLDTTTWAVPRVGVQDRDASLRFAAKVVVRGR